MELIHNIAQFIAEMMFYGIIDFVVVAAIAITYDSHKQHKEDKHDAEVN